MKYIDAIVLGLIQGLTEFLPVSSSGHLILAEKWGIGEPSLTLNILLHLGTLLAVVCVFYRQLFELLKKPFSRQMQLYIVACIPTAIIALIIKYCFSDALMGSFLPLCFMTTAVLLMFADFYKPNTIMTLDSKTALLTGVSQGIAVLPGISRSGATISTLILLGADKEKALEFSFILSVPIIILSAISELIFSKSYIQIDLLPVLCGMFTAFLSGLFAIKIMLKAVKQKRFWPFSVYLIIISIIAFITLY